MANPTTAVKTMTTDFNDTRRRWPLVNTAQSYYPGEMIGLTTAGYAAKFDDTAGMLFLGVCEERLTVPSGGSAGDYSLLVDRPALFSMAIASATVSDLGKLAYAHYSNEVQFAPGTYGNVVGVAIARLSGSEVLLAPTNRHNYRGHGAARVLAAIGNQSLNRFDLNKTIAIPNTATLTVTLPAVAETQVGDELRFVKTSADAAAITLDGNASETINGNATFADLDAAYDSVTLVSSGTAWILLNRNIA